MAKAFVGSNPTPRTTIADDSRSGVFRISRRGGLVHAFLFLLVAGVWLVRVCFLPVFLFWVWIGVSWGWGEALGSPGILAWWGCL